MERMDQISTNDQLQEFLRQVDYLHDAIIRECAIVARGYVDTEYRLFGDTEPFDAKIFIQTQSSEVPAIEIEFNGVTRFCVDEPFDLMPSGVIDQAGVHFSFVTGTGEEPQVVASAMRYRLLDSSCLGTGHLLVTQRIEKSEKG